MPNNGVTFCLKSATIQTTKTHHSFVSSEARNMKLHLSDPSNIYSLEVPFSRKREQTLANNTSTTIKISLDDPAQWPNYIFENSRYAIFIWHQSEQKMLLLSCGLGMNKNFRKQQCKTAAQFLGKIRNYITTC